MRITLKQLNVFCAIYQQQSTVQAAQVLCLSQSAVSSALTELERQLGVLLFERVGRQLIANENSRVLYPKALSLLEQVADIESSFQAHHVNIHIGASSTIGNYLLPALLAEFLRDFPAVQFKVTIDNSHKITAGIADMRFDVALIEGRFTHPDVILQPWQTDELILFAAKQSQWLPAHVACVSMADLSRCPLIVREVGSGTRITIEEQLLPQIPHAKIALELGTSEAIKHAVLQDLGVGCLSRHTLSAELAAGRLMEIHAQIAPIYRTLWLAQHQYKRPGATLQHFINRLLQEK